MIRSIISGGPVVDSHGFRVRGREAAAHDLVVHFNFFRRDGLDALDVHLTRTATRYCLIWALIGLRSIALAWFGGIRWVPYAGKVYGLLGPLQGWNGIRGGRLAPVRVE